MERDADRSNEHTTLLDRASAAIDEARSLAQVADQIRQTIWNARVRRTERAFIERASLAALRNVEAIH